jgi:hypothetical protein
LISKDIHDLALKMGYVFPKEFYHELKTEMWKSWKERFGQLRAEFEIYDFLYDLIKRLGLRVKDAIKFIPSITEIIYKYDLEYIILKPSAKRVLEKLRSMSYSIGVGILQ